MGTFQRHLLTKLTDEEVNARAGEMARAYADRDAAKTKHSAAVAERKAAVDAAETRLKDLARVVNDRAEHRVVDCEEREDNATLEILTLRLDTGEVLGRRPMTPEERQKKIFDISAAKGKRAAKDASPERGPFDHSDKPTDGA